MEYQQLECYSKRKKIKSRDFSTRSFCWRHVSVWSSRLISRGVFRRARYKDVQILCDVNGFVASESLVAVMGPSGSGKTTLLATISHRLKDGFKGDIYVNGEAISGREMTSISGFAAQNILAVDSLTVYEHFYFMAALKMHKDTSEMDKLGRISSLMSQFSLEKNSSTCLKDLSGGERKRLSIAVELLTDPYILFCDEPTTGLDSSNATIVVDILKKITIQGKIVICSIHQPASGLFEMFDDVLLLATGGRVTYFGRVIDAAEYFERIFLKCPTSYNMAEYLINVISIRDSSDSDRVKSLCDTYTASEQAGMIADKIRISCAPSTSFRYQNLIHLEYNEMKRPRLLVQLYYLIWRALKSLRISYIDRAIHSGCFLSVVVVSSLIYSKILYDDRTREQNIHGFMSVLVEHSVFPLVYSLVQTFPRERALLLREIGSGLYSVQAYYFSKIILEVVHWIVVLNVFVMIIKSLSDVFDHLSYMQLLAVFFVLFMASVALGFVLSAAFDDVCLSKIAVDVFLNTTYLFSGISSVLSSIPIYVRWMKYLSLFYYGIETLTMLEWRSIEIENAKYSNNSVHDDLPKVIHNFIPVSEYGFSVMDLSFNFYTLIGITIFLHFVAYFFIWKKSKEQAVY